MSKKLPPPDPRAAEIDKLKEALFFARKTIVDLLPEPQQEVLNAGRWCETVSDVYEWVDWAVTKILAMADRYGVEEIDSYPGSHRGYCPLCKGSSMSPYSVGFALPTGLRRHLEGSHGSRRCEVLETIRAASLEAIHEKSQPGYSGPNWASLIDSPPPWKVVEPEPERPSAQVLKFPGN